jgi:hypothetical protein
MVEDLDKINWVKISGVIHSVYSIVEIREQKYAKSDCEKLISLEDSSIVELKADKDVSEYNIKRSGEFCQLCRDDILTICEYD